ncbi:hypothetical protein N0B31_07470 [Salinirubellus salinus]|uniref:Lipoprotein n=1 Tax=Salinirubellus salinus TaxID=1364945 RepID=A0A9E7R5U8_9EURY|nr:hypothetical protein [Salinirubellus salinus]UWM56122.1 hypothetical protein N0B31_07470 [Salinirubellus salinus]
MRTTRRGLLAGLAIAVAGCTAPGDGGGVDGSGTPTATPTGTATVDDGATPTVESTPGTPSTAADPSPEGELDLREANVTSVEFSRSGAAVTFDVTLHHDDDGEQGYANWWQVERLDGTRLGRRELTHPHGTREFTRSDTYEIPDGVSCVVVRGHDQTHGYGGQVALVNLGSGAVELVRQGPEARSFGSQDCP